MIDLPEVLEALRAVVAEKSAGYVYREEACVYAIDGKPACIAGHVYNQLGLLDQVTCDSVTAAYCLHSDKITGPGRNALGLAQQVQDGSNRSKRGTWGEALAAAEDAR